MKLKKIKFFLRLFLPYGLVQKQLSLKNAGKVLASPQLHWQLPSRQHDECLIMAGGPSVMALLPALKSYSAHADVLTVNAGLKNVALHALCPRMHVLIDPAYFISCAASIYDAQRVEKAIADVRESLKAVTWPLTLYVPEGVYQQALHAYGGNSHVSLASVPLAPPPDHLPDSERYLFMDQGFYGCGAGNVVVPALYLAIAAGYKKIWLVGVEADMLNGLHVDQFCRTYFAITHHYHAEASIVYEPAPASDSYRCMARSTKAMDFAQIYAKSRNVQIVNLSVTSLRDSFPKGILGQSPYPYLRDSQPHMIDDRATL